MQLIDLVLLLADHVQQSIDLMFLLILQLLMDLAQAWGTVVVARILHLSRTRRLGIIEMEVRHQRGSSALGGAGAWRVGVAHAGIDGCSSLQR